MGPFAVIQLWVPTSAGSCLHLVCRLDNDLSLKVWHKTLLMSIMHTDIEQSGVSGNAWVIHLDKRIFSKDADKFRSERWTEEPDCVAIMSTQFRPVHYSPIRHSNIKTWCNFLSFGAGSSCCVGSSRLDSDLSLVCHWMKLIPIVDVGWLETSKASRKYPMPVQSKS
nr:hypothetical protein CFP56_34671 [Quercus suber]